MVQAYPVVALDDMRAAHLQVTIGLPIARQLPPVIIHYAHVHKGRHPSLHGSSPAYKVHIDGCMSTCAK